MRCSPARCRPNMAFTRPAFSTSPPRAERRWPAAVSASTAAAARPSPSFEYGGVEGKTEYFVTGRYLSTGLGLEPPTSFLTPFTITPNTAGSSPTRRRCSTIQRRGWSPFRVSARADTRFPTIRAAWQRGALRGLHPATPHLRMVPPPVSRLYGVRRPRFQFEHPQSKPIREERLQRHCLAEIRSNFDAQLSYYSRYSDLHFVPDPVGDLFNNKSRPMFSAAPSSMAFPATSRTASTTCTPSAPGSSRKASRPGSQP